MQARRHGGAFRCRAPQSEKCAPQARVVPQKKVIGPVPLECTLGPGLPQNTACAPQA